MTLGLFKRSKGEISQAVGDHLSLLSLDASNDLFQAGHGGTGL